MFRWLDWIIYRLAVDQFSDYAQEVNQRVLLLARADDISLKIANDIPLDQQNANQFVELIRLVAKEMGDTYWACWALRVVLESWGKKFDVFLAHRAWSEFVVEKSLRATKDIMLLNRFCQIWPYFWSEP